MNGNLSSPGVQEHGDAPSPHTGAGEVSWISAAVR